jgi:hypothetical protein
MIFLASVTQVNTLYEARVTVTDDDCYFAAHHAFVDGTPKPLSSIPEAAQEALLADGCEMFDEDNREDVAYDLMRDAV